MLERYYSRLKNDIIKTNTYQDFLKLRTSNDFQIETPFDTSLVKESYLKMSDYEINQILLNIIDLPIRTQQILNEEIERRKLIKSDIIENKRKLYGGLTFDEIENLDDNKKMKHLLNLSKTEIDDYHKEFLK